MTDRINLVLEKSKSIEATTKNIQTMAYVMTTLLIAGMFQHLGTEGEGLVPRWWAENTSFELMHWISLIGITIGCAIFTFFYHIVHRRQLLLLHECYEFIIKKLDLGEDEERVSEILKWKSVGHKRLAWMSDYSALAPIGFLWSVYLIIVFL